MGTLYLDGKPTVGPLVSDLNLNGYDLTKNFEALAKSFMRNPFRSLETSSGWTATNVGSGGSSQTANRVRSSTGATAASSNLIYAYAGFFSQIALTNLQAIDWDKKFLLAFDLLRSNSDANSTWWVQLKEVLTIGNLAAKGIGVTGANLACTLESYGTSRNTQASGVTLTNNTVVRIGILHVPATPKIELWMGVAAALALKATETTAAKMPTGLAGGDNVLMVASENGTPGANIEVMISNIILYQEQDS